MVPAYGYGMLRKPDPRFEALMDFADTQPGVLANPVFQLVKKNSEIALVCSQSMARRRTLILTLILPLVCSSIAMGSTAAVLHCYLWCQSCVGSVGSVGLGPCFGSAY